MSQPANHAEAIVDALLGIPREERAAYLEQACGADAQQRLLVEGMLKAHEQADALIQMRGEQARKTIAVAPFPISEKPGDRIGRYKLLQQIGEGGCGVVYLAEQSEPVRRRVALKVIKPGMDTRQVIARFEAERQALAMMDHPNIAKVFDGGVTETGRPFFVMELVKGLPITRYCDEHKLSTAERLELGVRLYELLTGRTAFEDKSPGTATIADFGRINREDAALTRSTRLSALDKSDQTTVPHARPCEPPKLIGLILGHLDSIVMKTLEK